MKVEWIPTKERLPENRTYVLTTIYVPGKRRRVRSGWYHDGFFTNDNGDVWRSIDKEVIAWCYQPDPYQESEDE